MTILDIKQAIKDKSFDDFYIFAGDEIEIQRVYINKIAEVSGKDVIRANSISDVWSLMTGPSLFDTRNVYVVRDDKDFLSDEVLQSRITQDVLNGNILILLLTNVDKRTKLYKQFSDKIVVFERLSTEVLVKYIQREIALNNANCERLTAICENDYSRILLEIDKIKRYATEDYDNAFECLVEQGVIYTPPADAIFSLVDAILLRRSVKQVYNLLYQCYAVGEANMVILSVLYNNAKQVLQVQSHKGPDIAKSTGLTPWQVKCAKGKCGRYTNGELVGILRLIQKIQKGIITGKIEDQVSVEYLLAQIL